MYNSINTDLTDGIFTITINRPDKLNALNKQVLSELGSAVDEIRENKDIRAAIITGAGQKAFVAGADIAEFIEMPPGEGEKLARRGQQIFFDIENSGKPIVAAVNGFALGGGCELALACHFRLASDNAKFGQPEVNLGIIPGYGGTQRLTLLVGKGKALELMMTGDMVDAQEAMQLGIVNHITTQQDLLQKTRSILFRIIEKSPVAISKLISAVNAAFKDGDGFSEEARLFAEAFASDDKIEGTNAFLEKRKPSFKGY